MRGSNPRLKMARLRVGIRSTDSRLQPVAISSRILPASSIEASGSSSRPARKRLEANISGLTSRGDLYSGPSRRYSTRSIANAARRITNRAKSRGFSAIVVSFHCWRSSDTFAGSPATTRAREGSLRRMPRWSTTGGR